MSDASSLLISPRIALSLIGVVQTRQRRKSTASPHGSLLATTVARDSMLACGLQRASAPLRCPWPRRQYLAAVARRSSHRARQPHAAARRLACAAMEGSQAAPAAAAEPTSSGSGAPSSSGGDPLLQYVVLRRDLWTDLGWPLGSVVAQGCHAATAALWLTRDSATTQQYCAPENLDHMHKVGAGGQCVKGERERQAGPRSRE